MKKYILFGGCLLLLAYITSCDDGRIYEKTETLSEEGRTLRMSGRISGINKWPDGYSVVVAGFSDESEYADEITLGRSIINRTEFNLTSSNS